MLAAANKTMFW